MKKRDVKKVLVGEIDPCCGDFEKEDTWISEDSIKVKSATNDQIRQLDASISKGEYVSLDEIDSVEEPISFETRQMEVVPSSEVFGRTMTPAEIREKEISRLEAQIHEQYQTIHQQQDKINKLSQTWMQKLKNMIGPLV